LFKNIVAPHIKTKLGHALYKPLQHLFE